MKNALTIAIEQLQARTGARNFWCSGTVWQGQTAMRIGISAWATTEADVESSLEAILRAAALSRFHAVNATIRCDPSHSPFGRSCMDPA